MSDTVTALPQRSVSREVQSAEAQIANVEEQISEHANNIMASETRVEAMQDQIRKERAYCRSEQREIDRNRSKRDIFIDTTAALRKLHR